MKSSFNCNEVSLYLQVYYDLEKCAVIYVFKRLFQYCLRYVLYNTYKNISLCIGITFMFVVIHLFIHLHFLN